MGAGWFEPEFRAVGLPFDQASTRIARLQESVQIIRSLLDGNTVDFSGHYYTVTGLSLGVSPDHRPPLLIGSGGRKMLSFAARVADIVGILPAPIRTPDDGDGATDRLPESFAAKVEVIRSEAGQRLQQLELGAFVTIRITDRKRDATEQLMAERGWTDVTAEDVWTMPTVFIGSRDEIRDLLVERRDRLGLSYFVSSDDDLDVFRRVIEGL